MPLITTESAIDVYLISPSDTADLPDPNTRAIRATNAGTVVIETPRSRELARTDPTQLKRTVNFEAGETRALRVLKVWSTGTTGGMGLEGLV